MKPNGDNAAGPVIALLAAGEGRRFGDIKQLADIAGEPMIRRVATGLLALHRPLLVITGAHADAVAQALVGLPLASVHHADWQQGLGSSIARAARHVRAHHAEATGMLVCLADQPLIARRHFQRLLDRHREAPDVLLASRHGEITGPPTLFPRDCLDDLAQWSDGRGAHALLQRESARLEQVMVDDPDDVDTAEDLHRIREKWQRRGHP